MTIDKLLSKNACHEAYKKYMKEWKWKMSEDEAPDLLVWSDAWKAALKWKEKSNKDSEIPSGKIIRDKNDNITGARPLTQEEAEQYRNKHSEKKTFDYHTIEGQPCKVTLEEGWDSEIIDGIMRVFQTKTP